MRFYASARCLTGCLPITNEVATSICRSCWRLFVHANDPAVDRILGKASQVLRKAGKADSIDGYRGGNRRRYGSWHRLFIRPSCISKLAMPFPSSLNVMVEDSFSRAIDDSKVATCLDTTLLFAAAFGQAVFESDCGTYGRACFGGVWWSRKISAVL